MDYQTVFEVSYFSNGELLRSAMFLLIGFVVAGVGVAGGFRLREKGGCALPMLVVWCAIWLTASCAMIGGALSSGWTYTNALRDGRCEVTEGVVEVLHQQPASGHDSGDRVRVNGRVFQYSYFSATLAYNRTIAQGGALTNGAKVRLHHLNGRILRVEIAG